MSEGGIVSRIAPWRFLTFLAVAIVAGSFCSPLGWRDAIMLGFDIGALVFIGLCVPVFSHEADEMRRMAKQNDANRVLLLGMTAMVSGVILVTITSVLVQQGERNPLEVALVLSTLCLSWLFSNLTYALHYAHLYYRAGQHGQDSGGIEMPQTNEPDYWDFLYFSTCLGMTFQTSDTDITSAHIRRTALFHCLAAFVFNLGVIAFSINVLGGGS
ncbi:DUF1345 domain-containing protein [Sphingomonas sp.]|uniref:DUF1345 domain-containing protein n=1 Tax=Sphingomonas sp. TaxID=28214 RepID=UPI003D6D98C8